MCGFQSSSSVNFSSCCSGSGRLSVVDNCVRICDVAASQGASGAFNNCVRPLFEEQQNATALLVVCNEEASPSAASSHTTTKALLAVGLLASFCLAS
jgi:hypothetical protein